MENIPKHVVIIPDGNRRWAKEKGLLTFEGHRRGFELTTKLVKKAKSLGIKVITLWGFSTENWNRSREEVGYLMKLYEMMIDQNLKQALKEKTRIIHIGRKDRFSDVLRNKIIKAEEKAKSFSKFYLVIALDYGGKDEMLRAIKKILNFKFPFDSAQGKKITNINEDNFNQFLDTKDLPYPNPDLIIRTSGEQRTSGFMIWQAAYAEYIFIKEYFPDFSPRLFEKCIQAYSQRQRRFGK